MTLNLNAKEYQQNPYELYARLRQDEPLTRIKKSFSGEAYFVSRYDDVLQVLKDPRFFNERHKVTGGRDWTTSWWLPSIFRAFLHSMVMIDDPNHARLRNLVHKAFTPRIIQQMETRIREISNSLLDQAAKKPTFDLIADFALPLPLTVISELMGVPSQDQHKFHQLMSKLLDVGSSGSPLTLLTQFPNAIALNRFFRDLIALKRRDPQNDLITLLVQAEEKGDTLSEDELVAMLFLLLLAGHETTVNLIGSGTFALLEHPEQLRRLTSDMTLLDSAIEEMLRFTNPVQQVVQRFALEDVELCGQTIPKGSAVIAGIASANRDATVFGNPEQFDITRDPNRHVAFGLGIHYCLGAPLARLEAKVAFTVLLTRFPTLKLAAPAETLEWRGGTTLRGLKHLPIALSS